MKVRQHKRAKLRAHFGKRRSARRWLRWAASTISKSLIRSMPPERNWFSLDMPKKAWKEMPR